MCALANQPMNFNFNLEFVKVFDKFLVKPSKKASKKASEDGTFLDWLQKRAAQKEHMRPKAGMIGDTETIQDVPRPVRAPNFTPITITPATPELIPQPEPARQK